MSRLLHLCTWPIIATLVAAGGPFLAAAEVKVALIIPDRVQHGLLKIGAFSAPRNTMNRSETCRVESVVLSFTQPLPTPVQGTSSLGRHRILTLGARDFPVQKEDCWCLTLDCRAAGTTTVAYDLVQTEDHHEVGPPIGRIRLTQYLKVGAPGLAPEREVTLALEDAKGPLADCRIEPMDPKNLPDPLRTRVVGDGQFALYHIVPVKQPEAGVEVKDAKPD